MECLYPRSKQLKQSRYQEILGILDDTNNGTMMSFPCGKCVPCRINYASEWAGRLYVEHINSSSAFFITLTFDEENLLNKWDDYGYDPESRQLDWSEITSLKKSDLQLFFKRLRKKLSVRYYAVGEYGGKGLRPHYHACVFFPKNYSIYDIYDIIFSAWGMGFITCKPLNAGHYTYITKYLVKRLISGVKHSFIRETGLVPEFSLSSRKPAIGFIKNISDLAYTITDGYIPTRDKKYRVAKYYRIQFKNIDPDRAKEIGRIKADDYESKHLNDPYDTYEALKLNADYITQRYLDRQSIIK